MSCPYLSSSAWNRAGLSCAVTEDEARDRGGACVHVCVRVCVSV